MQHQAGGAKAKVVSVIVFVDLRPNIFARAVGMGVQMGNQPQRRAPLAAGGGGQMRIHKAVIVHGSIAKPHFPQLKSQLVRQIKLVHGRRGLRGVALAAAADGNIFQKTLHHEHSMVSSQNTAQSREKARFYTPLN